MPVIEAVFQGGVFKPLKEVQLPENQKVLITIATSSSQDVTAWLTEVRQFHQKIVAKRGHLPDSTPDIAADRVRDE